jgi:hypothetical protein
MWVSGKELEYKTGYQPERPDVFDDISRFLEICASKHREAFDSALIIVLVDVDNSRQDILVAAERVMRAKGWR